MVIVLSCKNKNTTPTREQPNVIIILTDDQGYQDVGCFGSPDIDTPYLDKMAQEGLIATNFYATQAVCSARCRVSDGS